MSEEGHAAPTPAAKPGAAPAVDVVEELAKQIFVQLSGHVYSRADGAKPDPKAVVAMSFKLAEAFIAGNFEFNTAARERREAKAKASVDVSKIEIDFGSISSAKK
ncbi:MAG: hypothetical protein HYS35_04555 [Betaproteobacteria bacterium]|nr:hypothetical protein [Betaproteobacteria bacterium]